MQAETFAHDKCTGTKHVYGPGYHRLKVDDVLSSLKVSHCGNYAADSCTCQGLFNFKMMGGHWVNAGQSQGPRGQNCGAAGLRAGPSP